MGSTRRGRLAAALVASAVVVAAVAVGAPPVGGEVRGLSGTVESGGLPLAGYEVTLYRTVPGAAPEVIGSDTTDASGGFGIEHALVADAERVAYLVARSPGPDGVALATVLGDAPAATATVNPRTTVAFAYATAQFLEEAGLVGPVPGVPNGASMAANLADPVSGSIGSVLDTPPNGDETSARATANSVANVVAACVDSAAACTALRTATAPAGGPVPDDTLQALGNLVRQPTLGVDAVFALSELGPTPYQPAREVPPDTWTVALRFDGGPDVADADRMNGPANFVMDHEGTMWVANNYSYAPPGEEACASDILLRFAPDGSYLPGTPYRGGGLSGAGYGIARDRYGDVWVSNFGFSAVECADQPPHDSMSRFRSDGSPVSPPEGYRPAGVDWPQGMEFSPGGDLWVANCESDSVTVLPGGDPSRARELTDLGVTKPFDVAFGSDGNAYVTGTESDNVAVVAPDGTPVAGSPFGGFHKPMGIAADRTGALWIANSGLIDLPCPQKSVVAEPPPSLGYWDPATGERRTFEGGGLFIPWGVSVDGHDNVWVSNFGGFRLSGFCGRDDSPHCPDGVGKGEPLAPDPGFTFDGLHRSTATATDSAGNVWVTNNWKTDPPEINPGGYQVVVFLGIAGPVTVADPEPRPDPPTPAPAPPARTAVPAVSPPRFTG